MNNRLTSIAISILATIFPARSDLFLFIGSEMWQFTWGKRIMSIGINWSRICVHFTLFLSLTLTSTRCTASDQPDRQRKNRLAKNQLVKYGCGTFFGQQQWANKSHVTSLFVNNKWNKAKHQTTREPKRKDQNTTMLAHRVRKCPLHVTVVCVRSHRQKKRGKKWIIANIHDWESENGFGAFVDMSFNPLYTSSFCMFEVCFWGLNDYTALNIVTAKDLFFGFFSRRSLRLFDMKFMCCEVIYSAC